MGTGSRAVAAVAADMEWVMTKEECKLLQRLMDENERLREHVRALEAVLKAATRTPQAVPCPYPVPVFPAPPKITWVYEPVTTTGVLQ